jgi:oligosaccharide repeat unit polymerase
MFLVTGLGMAYFKFDVLYPFVWLSFAFIIYNISVYVFELMGIKESPTYPIILNSLFIAICTLFFYCAFFMPQVKKKKLKNDFLTEKNARIIKNMMNVLGFYLLICILLFLRSEYSSKLEMNLHGGIFGFGIVSRWFTLLLILYITYKMNKERKFPYITFFCAVILTILLSLFIGERDVFLTVVLGGFLVYNNFFKQHFIKIIPFIIFSFAAVIYLGEYRQITNMSENYLFDFADKTLPEKLFGAEFGASAHNFEVILENENQWEFQNGKGLIQDIEATFVPSFILPVKTPSKIYNEQFNSRLSDGYGAGYSYLAEGYQQWGYVGVFVWTLLLIIITHGLYTKSHKTIFGFAAYIFMIALIIYAMRGDFSFVISPLFKQVFISYLILYFLLRKKKSYRFEELT